MRVGVKGADSIHGGYVALEPFGEYNIDGARRAPAGDEWFTGIKSFTVLKNSLYIFG